MKVYSVREKKGINHPAVSFAPPFVRMRYETQLVFLKCYEYFQARCLVSTVSKTVRITCRKQRGLNIRKVTSK